MSGYLTAVGDATCVTFEVTVDATVQPPVLLNNTILSRRGRRTGEVEMEGEKSSVKAELRTKSYAF